MAIVKLCVVVVEVMTKLTKGVGDKLAIRFLDAGPYFLRYEVIALDEKKAALLAIDFPPLSREVDRSVFDRSVEFYEKHIASMNEITRTLYRGLIEIDEFIPT